MGYGRIEAPRLTAVIPCYNEEGTLRGCVASLRGQTLPVEILVVDDGSADASVELCGELGVKVLRQDHRGPGAARNRGAREAAGNILLFVDADMTFAPDYAERLAAPVAAGTAAAACHWNERVANWESPWARCLTWYLGNPDGRRQPEKAPAKEYVYRAVRKDFFLESGGFAENEGKGDDASVAARTGVFAAIVPDAVCFHRNPESPAETFSDAAWDGAYLVAPPARRLRRCAGALLLYRNPLLMIWRGIARGAAKREWRLPLFAAVYAGGFVFGVCRALATGFYQK